MREPPPPLVDEELLSLLACPRCRQAVRVDEAAGRLVCDHCRLGFTVRDGIPIMVLDQALELDSAPAADREPGC